MTFHLLPGDLEVLKYQTQSKLTREMQTSLLLLCLLGSLSFLKLTTGPETNMKALGNLETRP